MIAYKVVFYDGEKYFSCLEDQPNSMVEYIPGKWVSAHDWLSECGYHLLVFDNLKDANRFVSNLYWNKRSYQVWEVEIAGIIDPLPLPLTCAGGPPYYYSLWPTGTIMVKRVKLIREVK